MPENGEPWEQADLARKLEQIGQRNEGFTTHRYDGRQEGPTSITEETAFHILIRMVGLAARCALGDGLDRETVARVLEDEAYAIRTQDVAEDMSPIEFHHA